MAKLLYRLTTLLPALFLSILLLPFTAGAADNMKDLPTVRVAYFYNGDFMHKDKNGAFAGYDIEYYYTIAGYAGWNIRIVEYESLHAALDALEKGDIDIMSGLSRTEERERNYLVSSKKMCTARIAVQTRADDDRFTAGDTSTMTNLRCGIVRGSNVISLYSRWCRDNGLTPHITEYNSLESRNAALASGEVDAIAAGSTIRGAQKIAEFPTLDLYFMFNRNRGDLKAQTDRAMGILSLENPGYFMRLYEDNLPSSRNSAPSFSAGEKAFISAHPTIRVAVLENDAPFSFTGPEATAAGFLPEYFAHLGEIMGTTVECIPCSSKDDAIAALNAGMVDIVGKVEDNVFDSHARHVILTQTYLEMSMVQITRAGRNKVKSAAVPECNTDFVRNALEEENLPIRMHIFRNTEACFTALRDNAADAVICPLPAAAWLLNRHRTSDYVVSMFGGGTWNITCALPLSHDGNTLRSILNKIFAIDDNFINKLITVDTLKNSADLSTFFDRLPVSFTATFAAITVLLLFLAVAALLIIIRRGRIEKKLAAQQTELAAEMKASKARRAFFGAISHDMRTPLNGIMGFANLALKSENTDEIRDYLSKIRVSGNILSELVNDTLFMSRMENGKYALAPAPNETTEIFRGILEPVRELAREKKVIFIDNVSDLRPRHIMADRLSLQKIFINLLSNAVKFTPAGGTVSLLCRQGSQDGTQPDIITVSDTGQGISKEFLPHIFEPFSQEAAAGSESSGSGMGLSIVKCIVDAMGGTIEVTSEKQKGTTVVVRLHVQEIAPPAAPAGENLPDTGSLRGKRILVCEDNRLNLEIVKAILTRLGMEAVGVENGQLGLEAFEKSAPGSFAAILLDLRMPVLDGKATARAIRMLQRIDAESIPIFAISADAYPEDVAECKAAGMNGHIAKPVNPAELATVLATALK